MIEKLGYENKRIFDFYLEDNKTTLCLTEACDNYFSAYLIKKEVIELANDFMKIAESMN